MRPSFFLVALLIPAAACQAVTSTDDGHDHEHGSGGERSHGGEGGSTDPGEGTAGVGLGGDSHSGTEEKGTLSCGPPGACALVECQAEDRGGDHTELCASLSPHTNPVTSGPHYGYWANFGIYQDPIPDGFLLHSLEHSAVALLYNCALVEEAGDSCEELVEQLETFYEKFPEDPLCTGVPHRLIVAPSETLDVPFAATAWNFHLKGNCFDSDRVRAFIEDHYGKNYENICSSGVDPAEADCP